MPGYFFPAATSFFNIYPMQMYENFPQFNSRNYPAALFLHLHSSFRDNNSPGRAIITMGAVPPRPRMRDVLATCARIIHLVGKFIRTEFTARDDCHEYQSRLRAVLIHRLRGEPSR